VFDSDMARLRKVKMADGELEKYDLDDYDL
jgi:hypothetical protein